MKNISYKKLLIKNRAKIGVWGTGYIGYSTIMAYAKAGVKGIGYDVNPKRINDLNNGKIDIPGLEKWIGYSVEPFIKKGLVKGVHNPGEMLAEDIIVHFICVPTENLEKPTNKFLLQVMNEILNRPIYSTKALIIVESTLTPGTTENLLLTLIRKKGLIPSEDVYLVVAPRRDWFVEETKNLKTLDRVFGTNTTRESVIAQEVLSIVCEKLHSASSCREAEVTKSVENAYRQMDIALANQLSLAYPNLNIREVLRLVGTKWNINTYHPGFGTGGYCIPLASKYVLKGATNPNALTLLQETISTEKIMPKMVVKSIIKRGIQRVGILGLSYKGNIKVPTISPTIAISRLLVEENIDVKIFDPYYTQSEIKEIAKVLTFRFPQDLKQFDALLLVADHSQFLRSDLEKRLKLSKRLKLVLDNTGLWKGFNLGENIKYYLSGDPGWLNE